MSLEPIIDLIENNGTILSWNDKSKCLSLIIPEFGPPEWFFNDRDNYITLGSKEHIQEFDSKTFIECLLKFKDK